MEFIRTSINDVIIVKPKIFEDSRGYFYESFNEKLFLENFNEVNFVQDNQSLSQKDVLRGLHFQNPPYAQGKLVRVIKGAVLDVVVDIRKKSPTYGHNFTVELNEINKLQLWIPTGFAHGFLTLENDTIFSYKCTNYYNKDSEDCIFWNDADLNINWNVSNPLISDKDKFGKTFNSFESQF